MPTDRIIDGKDIAPLLRMEDGATSPHQAYFFYKTTTMKSVRQGKWKLHLPREKEPIGAAPFSRNTHIAPADRVGFSQPFLVNLEADIGETNDVSKQNSQVVERLLALAESMREDLGDYDRVGQNMRFFDPLDARPQVPPVPVPRQRQKSKSKPKSKSKSN